MKTQHPRNSGHLTNRINSLSKELKGHIAALTGMHEGNLSYDEMKHWTKSQFLDIYIALTDIEHQSIKLIKEEHNELE